MENRSSRTLWLMFAGALLGAVLTTWLGPRFIAWYFEPPAQYGFNCRAPIEWALSHLQMAQLVGVAVGGLGGMTLGLTVLKRKQLTA